MALQHVVNPSLVEVGKIKCGRKGPPRKTNDGDGEWQPPLKLDHFLITTMFRDDTGNLVIDDELMKSLQEHADKDGKLRRIPITVLSNDLTQVMQANYVHYKGKTLAAKSDGLTITEFFDAPGGKLLPEPKTLPHTPEAAERWKFKRAIRLNVMITSPIARWGGIYTFRSTSRISGDQLYGSLSRLQQGTGGILRGLPLWMVLRPIVVTPEGKATTVYVAHVELVGGDIIAVREKVMAQMQFELQNARQLRQMEREYRQLLRHQDTLLDDEEIDTEEPKAIGAGSPVITDDHGEQPAVVTATTPTAPPPVTAETKQPQTEPPQSPPPVDKAMLPETYSTDKKAMFSLLKRKGQDWQTGTTWLNLKFKTGYTSSARWDDVPEKHRLVMAEMLIAMADNPKKG